MESTLNTAFAAGYERLAAWADLLDQINVYPVADADTGRNLMISLAPLRHMKDDHQTTAHKLLMTATGNSGNIANCFFSEFVATIFKDSIELAANQGRQRAWKAVVDPQPGTMLSVLDTLTEQLDKKVPKDWVAFYPVLVQALQSSVKSTANGLPIIQAAGVVDAGALGLYLFMEGFFAHLASQTDRLRPITETFEGKLTIAASFQSNEQSGFCVDTVIAADKGEKTSLADLADIGESIVATHEKGKLKIHLHTRDRDEARLALETLGEVLQWSDEALETETAATQTSPATANIRIVTDAAGSISRRRAREAGITLLDSYIVEGGLSLPETVVSPQSLYRSMSDGARVTTAQASVFERHQRYQSIASRFPQALYLCVGSVYTGNYEAACVWQKKHDPNNRFKIIDTGCASGRLGIVVLAVADFANQGHSMEKVVQFAQQAIEKSDEYLFLDRLKYLVAGGRISKSKGFMGDLLHMKPVITPTADGAAKAGTVRNRDQQVALAMEKIEKVNQQSKRFTIMLEYSDNRQWVEEVVLNKITHEYPQAMVTLMPLSLTSGAHMGPGTWGVALLPSIQVA